MKHHRTSIEKEASQGVIPVYQCDKDWKIKKSCRFISPQVKLTDYLSLCNEIKRLDFFSSRSYNS